MTARHVTDPAWHELVAEAAGATAFHLPAWGWSARRDLRLDAAGETEVVP
ncbi:MAG TPA: hypothetical protein VKF59_13240 [Candidatus Dormibacteraeota bacterium]|nr:hypothetical protein [Candidatus Dormibacteraeota bacterium]